MASSIFHSLSRVTSSTRYIPAIDGLRVVAIMLVVLYHLQGDLWAHHPYLSLAPNLRWLNAMLLSGNFGVKIFFVISGFVLALPFAREHLSGERQVAIGQYFLRRITRIEPPYLIALCVWALAIMFKQKQSALQLAPDFFLSLFYLNNYFHSGMPAICFVGWSLEVEIQFYVLAPMLASAFLIKQKIVRRTILVLAIVVLAAMQIHVGAGINVLLFMHFFLVGFLLCDFYLQDWQSFSASPYLWDAVGFCAWSAISWLLIQGIVDTAAVICLFFAFAGVLRGRLLLRFFSQRLLVLIGGMSYTIYLYHSLILSALSKQFGNLLPDHAYGTSLLCHVLVFVPVLIVISAIVFLITEKPFMQVDWVIRGKRLLSLEKLV